LVAALQTGLALARGRWIARMDADDVCHPERLAAQVKLLAENPSLGLVSCLVAHGGDPVRQGGFARHIAWLNSLITPEEIALNRFVESPVAHPSVMFRRELPQAHGGYRDGSWPEDYELWLRWLERGVRFAKVPRVLLTWHDRDTRLSRCDPRYSAEAFYTLKAGHLAPVIERTRAGREVWIWGAGRVTRARVRRLETAGVRVSGFIDIDPKKQGRHRDGRLVVSPADMPGRERALVLGYVAKPGARELIRGELRRRGFMEGADFWMAA
jgi:glycosyltransferase involved in cell wall biosynthesis